VSLTPELFRDLVGEARLAPSVHNIQPTRWRMLNDERLALVADTAVRIPCADPTGHDVRVSHGAALEGMNLALGRRGLRIVDLAIVNERPSGHYTTLCILTVGKGGVMDPLQGSVARRMSWRGTFRRSPDDSERIGRIAAARDDVTCITDERRIAEVARQADEAELFFVCRDDYRRELLGWMRLFPRHPRYHIDGLNREALAMSAVEALGARFILGGLFTPLNRLGIAAPLMSDRRKTMSASGLVLFHRPRDEDPLLTGRHFYRVWLEIERAGFSACPISALADHPALNRRLSTSAGMPEERRLVNVFRVGQRPISEMARHFRAPVDRLIV
jgi:nitroreductase